jgi:hypothetical protein
LQDLGGWKMSSISLGELRTMLAFAMHQNMVDVHEVLNVVETNLDLNEGCIAAIARDIEGGTTKLKNITTALHRAQMKAVCDVFDFINDDDATVQLRSTSPLHR